MYGEAYLAAVPLLQIITWYSAFAYMGSVRNIWMLAEEKQKISVDHQSVRSVDQCDGKFGSDSLYGCCRCSGFLSYDSILYQFCAVPPDQTHQTYLPADLQSDQS